MMRIHIDFYACYISRVYKNTNSWKRHIKLGHIAINYAQYCSQQKQILACTELSNNIGTAFRNRILGE